MVSTLNFDEQYNRVRRNFCFYLDIHDHGLARSISRRIQDMGLQQEVFLTSRVTHVVRDRSGCAGGAARWARRRERGARADAMLERVRSAAPPPPLPPTPPPHTTAHVQLTVHKAISLLDKLYDTYFTASRLAHVTHFTKQFIKIEFLDKLCRPIYKEFNEWPEISLEPDPPKKKETPENITNTTNTATQKMTRKSRPRIKEREEKEPKAGYCEMCNTDYADAALHRRSPHHLAFVRDHTNFLALDSLIDSGTDVNAFLDKSTPVNGERRSLRKMCNGDVETPKNTRSKRSQSTDSTVNGSQSPKRNGALDDERKHNTRCSKKATEAQEDRQYYKVVGVSTKLRSSGGFVSKRKDSTTLVNGTKPLVVKIRKVRRSELSVLSDEAEQFMFPKRASSTSSTSSDDDEEEERVVSTKRKSTPQPPATPMTERRRQARPLALKEESSEEDSWPESKSTRKRRAPPVAKRARRVPCRTQVSSPPLEPKEEELTEQELTVDPPKPEPELQRDTEVSPLREEPTERCMKWEDGRLKYTPAVEQLEFAFESVPHSEPWFETFKRQDQDKVLTKNIPQYFSLYSKSPKLPYEIGPLPPLKPNCCPLSDLVKREEKPGPSRSYGTRGMKKQKIRNRTAAILAMEAHPRKSPREHASTLAILGSAGLLHRPRHADDSKSTASEDTVSDSHSTLKVDPVISEISETLEASERLQQFLSEVFEDAADYEVSEEAMDGDASVTTSTNIPDVSSLVSECENCDLIRNELQEAAERPRGKRGKFKKKNRTGWPNKKKAKSSRTSSESDHKVDSSLDRSSAEPPDDETTQDTMSEDDTLMSETEKEDTIIETKSEDDSQEQTLTDSLEVSQDKMCDTSDSQDKTLLDLKISKEKKDDEKKAREVDAEDKELKRMRRALQGLGDCLRMQPIVRVARVDSGSARRLRSAGRTRANRFR